MILILMLILLGSDPISGQQPAPVSTTSEPADLVPLLSVVATPERYDGRRISVLGFVHFEFEGNAIYVHEEDFNRSLSTNSAGLALPTPPPPKWGALSGRYVLLEGTFRAKQGGGALRAGDFEQITRIQYWSSRAETEAFLRRPPVPARP
jgi:hypothetical protein